MSKYSRFLLSTCLSAIVSLLSLTAESAEIKLQKQNTIPSFDPQQYAYMHIPEYVRRVPNWQSSTSYDYEMVDLNNDQVNEVIIAIFSLGCGVWECDAHIVQWDGSQYKTIGTLGIQSSGGKVIVLPNQTHGMNDVAMPLYNNATRQTIWRRYRFDGLSYQNTLEEVNPQSGYVLFDAHVLFDAQW